jgi:hypothetical protein
MYGKTLKVMSSNTSVRSMGEQWLSPRNGPMASGDKLQDIKLFETFFNQANEYTTPICSSSNAVNCPLSTTSAEI